MRILGKIIKFLGNFIGIILSLVVSLALLVMLVATPMLSGLAAFTRPETIRQVVQEIDFAAIIQESFQGEMSEEERKTMEFLVEMTESNAFGDLVELYAIDITNAFEAESKPSVLTEEALRVIMENNMDELVDLVRDMGEVMGEDSSDYSDAELEEKVRELFDDVVDRFLEMAPTAQELRNLLAKISNEFTTDSSANNERPNNGMREETTDTPTYEYDDSEGDSHITYIPGDGTITTIIVNPDGTIQSGDGNYSYYIDEDGNIVFSGGDGGITAIGGTMTFGKAVAIDNYTVRVLLMSVNPGGNNGGAQEEEIADIVLKLAVMAKNGTLTLLFVGVIVVLALLICLFRWPRFKGLMWVAVMLLIGAVLVSLAGVAYTVLPGMVAGKAGASGSVLSAAEPVIKIIVNAMYTAAAIYTVVAIVLIVLFVLLRKALRKQKAAKEMAKAREAAIEEVAEETVADAEPMEIYEEVAVEAEACEEKAEETAETEEISAEEAEVPTEEAPCVEEEENPAE